MQGEHKESRPGERGHQDRRRCPESHPRLEGPFDFVFIDALKRDNEKYLDMVMPRMPVSGVIAAHNAISAARSTRDYLDAVETDPRFDTVILSTTTRDRLAITYKKAEQSPLPGD